MLAIRVNFLLRAWVKFTAVNYANNKKTAIFDSKFTVVNYVKNKNSKIGDENN